ncbi:retropepsin-like aspartic protease [Taibaiella soli]|uniref:Peptidase A2 domain-containing protein n=1 Tax=Taibaiella soli TaxID=1649169 RepID=A0A2W2A7J3_9BACT|nr:retropepsin-like aspartic protease [Taibaiella soli]PZF71211.1 hypothetical protein DN068_19760 [Taibaiella soli]
MIKQTTGFLIFFLFIFSAPSFAQRELRDYLDQADFFRLRDELAKHGSTIDADARLYFTAFVDNAFNRNELSIRRVDSFMALKKDDWYPKEIANLLQVQRDNYCKTYRYKDAAALGDVLLQHYNHVLDPVIIGDVANTNKIWGSLANVPPQRVEIHSDIQLPIKKDAASLWTLPVSSGNWQDDFIFDTGANISTVTSSVADKMKLRRFSTHFDVHGFQGTVVTTSLGIADSLNIGNMVLHNVVFMIMPDDALTFSKIQYTIHGIIGFPVISALKEVHIYRKGTLEIPANETALPFTESNLAIHGLFPMVQMGTDKGVYNFHFDTGAKITDLFDTYYVLHSNYIQRKGKRKVTEFESAGGKRSMEAYQLKKFKFYIGDKTATLPTVTILTKPIRSGSEMVYGNIGQDVMEQFDEMILNFDKMYVTFN